MSAARPKRWTCNHYNPLSAELKFRVTPAEKRQIQAHADAAGVTVSDWLRARLLIAAAANDLMTDRHAPATATAAGAKETL